jgi:zinc D-Ala-D-Ala carboxypeptidase
MGDLSANFSNWEMACQGGERCCGGSYPMHPALVASIQLFRDMVDVPVRVTSGFRCITHNARIGVLGSQHTLGRALDITADGMTVGEMAVVAEKIHLFRQGGIGVYDTWLHVDVGPIKRRKTAGGLWHVIQ